MTDDLQPGPEADALVATAMGWTWQEPSPDGWDGHWVTPDGEIPEHPPAYTTSGDGMLEMLEWIAGKRWAVEVEMKRYDGKWYARVCPSITGDALGGYAIAGTAPLAVAKALLAAKETGE